jgi:hypothetical protein
MKKPENSSTQMTMSSLKPFIQISIDFSCIFSLSVNTKKIVYFSVAWTTHQRWVLGFFIDIHVICHIFNIKNTNENKMKKIGIRG